MVMLVSTVVAFATELPYQVEWIQQLGTSESDWNRSVAIVDDSVYVTGTTRGDLGGTSVGDWDAYLAKYDLSGTLLWTQQLGTSGYDNSWCVAVDDAGNAYISGRTDGSLDGPNAGDFDAFLAKFDPSGTNLWTRQVGTSAYDESWSITTDGFGNLYISGYTDGDLGDINAGHSDAFLAKYDSSGTLLWTRQLGTSSDDRCYSVAVDSLGNTYITGRTGGSLGGANAGGYDALLVKYDSSGTLLWTRQLGSSDGDFSHAVAVDDLGNAYITGTTLSDLGGTNAGSYDAFLAKYDASGTLFWTRQIGTAEEDSSFLVSVDDSGNVYITGETYGDLGSANAGDSDMFLAKYDESGDLLWIQQLGTDDTDLGFSVAFDDAGNPYICGRTFGDLGGTNAGEADAFLVKFAPVPEPGTMALFASALLACAGAAVRKLRK